MTIPEFGLLVDYIKRKERLLKFERFVEAIHAPRTSSPYILAPLPPKLNNVTCAAGTFKFRHIFRDIIILTVSQD